MPKTKKTTKKSTGKPKLPRSKKVLLFGGGTVHDFRKICAVIKRHLSTVLRFSIDYVIEDYDVFLAERIAAYDLVVIYHTGGSLSAPQKRGLVEWVASGKGFVGVHSAADSFRDSPEYIAMLGGEFQAHPFIRPYIVSVDEKHPAVKGIQGYAAEYWEKWPVYEYKVTDEQYLLDYDPRVQLVATTMYRQRLWPVAWTKPWGKGKVYYLALGDKVAAVRNDFFKQMLIMGSLWASDGKPCEQTPTDRYAIS